MEKKRFSLACSAFPTACSMVGNPSANVEVLIRNNCSYRWCMLNTVCDDRQRRSVASCIWLMHGNDKLANKHPHSDSDMEKMASGRIFVPVLGFLIVQLVRVARKLGNLYPQRFLGWDHAQPAERSRKE